MRILICSRVAPLPPIMDGLRLQVSALAKALSEHHEVRILAYGRPGPGPPQVGSATLHLIEPERPAHFRQRVQLGVDELRRRRFEPDTLARGMADVLGEELSSFDPEVVHVASGKLAGLQARLEGRPAVLAALDATHLNIEAQAQMTKGLRRRYHLHQAKLIRRFIAAEYPHFDEIVVVSERDRAELKRIIPAARIEIITNGVDAEQFSSDPNVERERGRIIFTGALNYPPNVAAATFLARDVMPVVRRAKPGATLVLVGRAPNAEIRALDTIEGVTVVGEVPEMNAWLSSSKVYMCPMLSGTGIKNKLLEALANGLPCIATPLATQGMTLEPNRDVLIAEDSVGLANHVIAVLNDEDLAASLGEAGRRYVRGNHNWEAVGQAYSNLYAALVSGGRGLPDVDH